MINRVGSMLTLFFTDAEGVQSFADVNNCDTGLFARYFKTSLDKGVYFAPSQYEACFVSAAHSKADLEKTIEVSYEALKALKQG